LGSTRKLGLNLEETIKWYKFTPTSPIKATPTEIASNQNVAGPASFRDADDIMLMSSSQSKDENNNYSTPTTSYPPEGKTTAEIAVTRGNPQYGYTCQRSNKLCKQRIVQVSC
jgi:hypothetical protein